VGPTCPRQSDARALPRSNEPTADSALLSREPLRAGRSVLDVLGLAQGIDCFLDGQEDCRFQ
jgi:hypothetical protein